MRYPSLQRLTNKLYFTSADVAGLLGIKPKSARVLCSRYSRQSLFVRLKRDFYVLDEKWRNRGREETFKIANYLQVPSYISFMTALSFYEVSTQVQKGFFESASLKRTVKYDQAGARFNYYKLSKAYYFDFVKVSDFFIATKEKAFADAVYLYSFGKYKIDFSALDIKKLDKARLKKIMAAFPAKTKKIIKRRCRI